MENIFDKYTSDMIFTNEGIKISIPLTGKVMPIEFKHCICDDIAVTLSDRLTDDLFNDGVTILDEVTLNKIELVMTIRADGTFTDIFELVYHNKPHSTTHHKFRSYDFPLPYQSIYRKKALRILKRLCSKGLNQPSNFKMSKYD